MVCRCMYIHFCLVHSVVDVDVDVDAVDDVVVVVCCFVFVVCWL